MRTPFLVASLLAVGLTGMIVNVIHVHTEMAKKSSRTSPTPSARDLTTFRDRKFPLGQQQQAKRKRPHSDKPTAYLRAMTIDRRRRAGGGADKDRNAWRHQWKSWKLPLAKRRAGGSLIYNPVFFEAASPGGWGIEDTNTQRTSFIGVILYNPSADMASTRNLKRVSAVWDSWVRPAIKVYLAVPLDVDITLPASSRVKILNVPEKEAYPPVKLELAKWKQESRQVRK